MTEIPIIERGYNRIFSCCLWHQSCEIFPEIWKKGKSIYKFRGNEKEIKILYYLPGSVKYQIIYSMYLVQAGFLIENPPLLQPLSFIFINVALIVSLRYELAKLHVLTSYTLLHLCVLRDFTFINESHLRNYLRIVFTCL